MAIFDLILSQTLGLEETKDYASIFEPMFEALGVEPEEYDWEMQGLEEMQDLEYVRAIALGNLIYAAQDVDIFPMYMDADDFDFTDGIHFDISSYDDEEAEEIREALTVFEDKTGIKVSIEE